MRTSRYSSDFLIAGGKARSTSYAIPIIRNALALGRISVTQITLKEGMRVDQIAGKFLGDSRLWWIISALSDIGWCMQVPAGTRIIIPTDMEQIRGII